ncbi:plasmid replication protein, CyRepA1 family [Gloeocapsa sp. PCC 73106]|uniref:plasmid replication protein, CyRepA1 family n=1 Tax=Gloeocapsa sp. PCC 73106 TaxID=102232 RepID=UPI000307B013|nr:plasmid replication protein, CyRepA1 family [Gloeocapsa sp. PCC 73106]
MDYFQEWAASGVDEAVTRLNVVSLEGRSPLDYLLYSEELSRRNDGRVESNVLRRYEHTEAGGWWCSGINLLTGEEDLWGCFKPDRPRKIDDKTIKYEHPPKANTGVFALKVPLDLWFAIAKRYDIDILPEDINTNQPDLGFWQWVINHPSLPICITEGAKKAGALLSANYIAIALPGINNGYRVCRDDYGVTTGKSSLIPQLQILATPNRPIYLAFDQDDKPSAIKAVTSAIVRLGYLCTQRGASVKVITWNRDLGKGVDDLIASQGQSGFTQVYETAINWDVWKAKSFGQFTQTVNLELNCRYLPLDVVPEQRQLIALKSPKGTGKTEFLAHIVAQAQAQGRKILVIGHRIKLLQALCQRFGISYLSGSSYGLCIDSLHPKSQAHFDPTTWEDAVIIIDEVEQVLWHALNSSTCKNQRVAILTTLKKLLQSVLNSRGKVYLADADLSDISLDYIIALSGRNIEPFVIYNRWQATAKEAMAVYNYPESTPKRLVRDLEKHIKEGGKPFVCLSAQKLTSPWGTRTLEAYLSKQFPQAKILRIDSESVLEPEVNLDKILPKYDIVLASPAIETGISINLRGHFTSVWAIAQGVQTPESVCQALARVRENIPRYIWVASYGFNRVGNGSTSIPSLLSSGHRITQANIRLLQQSDFDAIDDIDTVFQGESLLCWAKMAVRINASMLNYRACTQENLTANGYQLVEKLTATANSFREQNALTAAINAVQQQNYEAECQAVCQATDLSLQEYRQLKHKLVKTRAQKLSVRKYELKLRYGLSVTPQLVIQDDQGWYKQLRLHYFLTLGRQYLADRDACVAKIMIQQGSLFFPDFNNSQLGAIVNTMEILKIPEILNAGSRELKNSDEDLQAITAIALQHRSQIKAITGIGLSQTATPIRTMKRFLTQIGYDLQFVRVSKRLRLYRLVLPQDGRGVVFQYWFKMDQQYPGSSESGL